jgi:hypothetical protein
MPNMVDRHSAAAIRPAVDPRASIVAGGTARLSGARHFEIEVSVSTARPLGLRTYVTVSAVFGAWFMAEGGILALFHSAEWLAPSPLPRETSLAAVLSNVGLVAGWWAVGASLCAAAVGLWRKHAWALPIAVAGLCGVAVAGLALSTGPGGIGALLSFFALALAGLAYLGLSHVSAWTSERPSTAEPSTRWAFRLLLISAWLDLSIVLTCPLGLLAVGLAHMDNPRAMGDLATLLALLLWLSVLAGLKLLAWSLIADGSLWARRLAQVVVLCTALGAALPWIGWLRVVPIGAALAIEAALVVNAELDRSSRRAAQANPTLEAACSPATADRSPPT